MRKAFRMPPSSICVEAELRDHACGRNRDPRALHVPEDREAKEAAEDPPPHPPPITRHRGARPSYDRLAADGALHRDPRLRGVAISALENNCWRAPVVGACGSFPFVEAVVVTPHGAPVARKQGSGRVLRTTAFLYRLVPTGNNASARNTTPPILASGRRGYAGSANAK